jgi:hypothetical protein
MGYDPAKPATWSISQLRLYAAEHNITIPSGCEKPELVALVDECLTNALLAEHIRKENALNDAVLPNILAATAAEILHHKAYPTYAKPLRQHPQKLKEILDAGLHQLESLSFVAHLCGAQLQAPLSGWLEQVANAEDGGVSFQAALTPAEGVAPASAVCGRFCRDGDMVVRCLDCGADPTCVMCMDCFRHSPCVNHRYRITQGSGGGMCDCGDPTAWKLESFCSRHRRPTAAAPAGEANAEAGGGLSALDTLAEEDRAWVVVLLRGVIQFISLTLLQYLRIGEAQKRAKAMEKKGSKKAPAAPSISGGSSAAAAGAGAPPPPPTPKDAEASLMDDVALIADTYDWLAGWLVPVSNQLWALLSTTEVAKQIVAELWMEPLCWNAKLAAHHGSEEAGEGKGNTKAPVTAAAVKQKDLILAALPDSFSCLHPVFLFETLRPVTDRERPLKRSSPDSWRSVLAKCVGHCLSVPKLRLPVGALMATYAECINAHETSEDSSRYPLCEYQVQVLTNPDVVKFLMTPANMPYSNATNCVVHRVLSSILYALCVSLDQGPRNAILRTSSVATDGLVFIEHQNEYLSYGGVTVLHYSLTSLPAACYTLVLNRLAWRAFVQIHGTLAISGYICADPDAPTDATRFPAPDFFARILSRHTWLWFHAIRAVISALLRLPVDRSGSTVSPASAAALTAALQVPPEMWQWWTEATRFDPPPDASRRRRVFMQMLGSCQVKAGHEEAMLLLLQKGQLAAAQAAALQQHMVDEEGKGKELGHDAPAAATTTPAMHPSLAAAVGYTVQVLYEISRTMDAVAQKQRDGFCQRCHTIALEREQHTGAEALQGDEEGKDEYGEGGDAGLLQGAPPLTDDYGNDEEDEEAGNSRLSLPSSPALPPSQSPVDVLEYNLLQPAAHATTFSNHLPHMFGTVLMAWVIEQRRCLTATPAAGGGGKGATTTRTARLSGLCDDAVASTVSSTTLARPLRTLLDCFFKLRANAMPHPGQDRLTFCQQLLDALVMPQVLIGQVFDGLWRRDSYGVSAAVSMYIGFSRSVAAEFDILMLQVLTMELAPADMAIHVLRRFTYSKESRSAATKAEPEPGESRTPPRPSFSKYLNGYKHYLRLMLTLVVDSTKASFQPPLSSASIERTVAHYLAQKRASHSTITQVVSDSVRGGDFGAADEDEKDANGNVIRFTQVIDAALKKLATPQDSSRGKQFRLRDVQTWKANVCLYHSSLFDTQLEEVHKNYHSIALSSSPAESTTTTTTSEKDGDGSRNNRHPLPPTQLSDDAMYAELLPTTRALLHTDALLLPALYLLHKYVSTHRAAAPATAPPMPSSPSAETVEDEGSEDADLPGPESDSDDDKEDTNLITNEALLHAVTVLHLCVQDCRSITRAMRAVESAGDNAVAEESGSSDISWDLVELYLQRCRVNELSFTAASCAQVLPLPELTRPRTLLHKLQTPVTLHVGSSVTGKATTVRMTSEGMLHKLRTLLRSNQDADIYSCLEMVEEVLVLTGLATFTTAAAAAEQKLKKEAALSHKKLVQERQAKLLQRMLTRVMKAGTKDDASPTSATAASGGGFGSPIPASPHSPSSPSAKSSPAGAAAGGSVTGSLLTKLLLELATLDCCVCHNATEEPLFLLCHTSTSSVLPQLGALALPDDRGVHNHVCVCGHVAHKTCVEKLFVRLSVLWQRWNFRSQLFLGPTEFNCPLCNMIVTTLAPVPALPLGMPTPVTPSATVSLFEELQTGTVHPRGGSNDRTEDILVEFQTNLANSAVGLSPSEDIPAIVTAEDPLQKDNDGAWIQSETIRTVLYASHLVLEGVKAGQPISHRNLICLLSLLLSLVPRKLQASQAALRANFARTKRDADTLLLLDALLQPREAANLICTHVMTHVYSSTPQGYLSRLFASVEAQSSSLADGHNPHDATEAVPSSSSSSAFATAAAELEAAFPGTTIRVWQTLGVLTLLKTLLVEDASHAIVLTRESLTLTGTVAFTSLSTESIRTPAARCVAILRMLQYLLPVPHKSSTEKLEVVAHDIGEYVAGSTNPSAVATAFSLPSTLAALPYTGADSYVEQIAEQLLHLPRVYASILTSFAEQKICSVCHKEATNPVLCCRCGRHMCMHRQRSGQQPELYRHVRACSGSAVGVFLAVRQGTFYVMELTSGRLYSVQSNYVDEYGEQDRNLRRGVPLFRDAEGTQKLIELWMQNKWGAVSAVFTNSNRIDMTEL